METYPTSRVISPPSGIAFLSFMLCTAFVFLSISIKPSFAQAPISFGQSIASSIDEANEQDEYSFVANEGDMLWIMVSTNSGLDPLLEVYDPNGTNVIEDYFEGPGFLEEYIGPLTISGEYTIIISDNNYTKTGNYWIYVQRLNNPGMASPINFGENLSSALTSVYEVDTYSFDAVAGDVIQVRMSTDTELDAEWTLFHPDAPEGPFVAQDYVMGPNTIFQEIRLPVDGTYTLIVKDAADDIENGDYGTEIGDYWIYVQRLNNPDLARFVRFGENISSSITSPHQVDTYSFDAVAGDFLLVRMSTDNELDPEWFLFNADAPEGPYVNGSTDLGPNTTTEWFQIPVTGTYVLIAGDGLDVDYGDYGTETGPYWIYIQRLNNPGMASQIPFGETQKDSINNPHEVDSYRFDAFAGDQINIRMSTDTGLDPEWSLFNADAPEGPYVNGSTYPGPYTTFDSFPIPVTGTYVLIAGDGLDVENGDYGTETGPYWIYINRLNDPSEPTQIIYGQTIQTTLGSAYEVDAYSFDALSGDVIQLSIGTDMGLDVFTLLYGPDGSYITEVTLEGPGMEEIGTQDLMNTGTYTILVSNWGSGKETGTYTLSLNLITGNPGSLTITPTEGLHSVGLIGGVFSPTDKNYSLENKGNQPIEWNLTKNQPWLDLSSESGTIEAGGSYSVTVSLNQNMVNGFDTGIYTDTLTFTNETEANRTFLRSVSLKVDPIEGILEVSPEDNFLPSGAPGGPFDPPSITYTVKNIGERTMNWKASKTAYWVSLTPDHGTLDPGGTEEVIVSLTEVADALSMGVRTDTIAFTNQSNGYGNTTREIIFSAGVSPSEISAELSKNTIILGEHLGVSGKITPAPCNAGAWVDVLLISPNGEELHKSVIANTLGEYQYSLACGDLNRAGTWTLQASWNGDQCLGSAISAGQPLEVTKGDSRVTVDAGSRAVKLGDVVDISGKLTPEPDCGTNLMGKTVRLLIFGPKGRSDIQTVTASDRFGHFVLQDYEGLDALGQWNIQALFLGDDAYHESYSEVITIQVNETAGYAIIVEGKIADEEGLLSHNKTTNFVYEQFRQRGLLDEDIFYLNYDISQEHVDTIPSKAAIQTAISEWARDKMNDKPANLYIVMTDHGLEDRFYLYPEEITSEELDTWLDTLQNELFGQAAIQEIVILLGFCRSGSFIEKLSDWNRVIISSASADESSYKGPRDPNDQMGIRDGEFFITEFFKSVNAGKDILSCFHEAVLKTGIFTSTGTGVPNGPYRDDARQHPLLDDNGDGMGENEPSGDPGYDGYLSEGLFIGVSSVTGNDPGDVKVIDASSTRFLDVTQNEASFWARVDNNTRMRSLWLEVKAPNFDPGPGGIQQIEMDLPVHSYGGYHSAEDRYEWSQIPDFTDPGTYQIFFFARDDITGNSSSLKQTLVYKGKENNNPPEAFHLVSPQDESESRTVLLLDWEDSIDPDGDNMTYTVEIAEDINFSTMIHRTERIAQSHYFVDKSIGLKDLHTYYWRVIAVDYYGSLRSSDEVWSFNTDNTNLLSGWIKGYIYDVTTGQSLMNAEINIEGIILTSSLNGYYLGVLPPGVYHIETTVSGYTPLRYTGVVIPEGNIVTKDFGLDPLTFKEGDINMDYHIDLMDTILALQIISSSSPHTAVYTEADIDGNNKIGLEEVIYILQIVSELR